MKVGNRIPTLCKFYSNLDNDFKETIDEIIETNGDACSLLRLLKICDHLNELDLYSIVGFISVVMEKYVLIDERTSAYGFSFGDNDGVPIRLNPTLEDVLFLTGLPIMGNPVFPDKSRDVGAFERVFGGELLGSLGIHADKHIRITFLQKIALSTGQPTSKRIIAVLLLIIHCMIVPSHDGHMCPCSYVQFVEDLASVNSYAWGAALLAYLYHGMNSYKTKGLHSIKGNTSILVAFFLYHIPKLQVALGINVESVEPPSHLLTPVLKAIRSICHNTKTIGSKVNAIVSDITYADIVWRPYDARMLRPELIRQIRYRTLMAPIFCFNVVVNHSPHLVPNQFVEFDDHDLNGAGVFLRWIHVKENSGSNPQDFKTHYKRELELWAECHLGGTPQRYLLAYSRRRTHQAPDDSHMSHSSQQAFGCSPSQPLSHSSQQVLGFSQPQSSNAGPSYNESSPPSSPQSFHHSSAQLSLPRNSDPQSSRDERLAAMRTPLALGARLRKRPDALTYSSGHIPQRQKKKRRR